MKQVREIYDGVFKEKAVHLSYERANISGIFKELGVSAPRLYKWRKEYEEFGQGSFPGNGNLKETLDQERISELERKFKDPELERDILKKAIDIFSKSGQGFILSSETMKRYFRLKRCAKYCKWDKADIIIGKVSPFQGENKESYLGKKR